MPNLNELARKITLQEGKKINLSIAQVKEVIRLVLLELGSLPEEEARATIDRYCQETGQVKPRVEK
jgi:predicted DNA-binding antitoxin AbrB/MazE fold protein